MVFTQLLAMAATLAIASQRGDMDFDHPTSRSSNSQQRLHLQDGGFDPKNYYVSTKSADWNKANEDCKNHLGPNGHLVSIESKEEEKFIRKLMVDKSGSGTLYWTGGEYISSKHGWVWNANDKPVESWAPWDKGYPKRPNSMLRVAAMYMDKSTAPWRSYPYSEQNRYICEVNSDN